MNFSGKENSILISVIVPAYNAATTITRCLDSVLKQTYRNWELIIIEDGSTDGTAPVIENFLARINSDQNYAIQFVQQANQGPSAARNLGIKLSKGSFIAFLDSDDMWYDDKLQLQMEYSKKYPKAGIISGGFNEVIFDSATEYRIISFNQLLRRNYFNTPTVFIKKERLSNKQFAVSQKFSEDYRLWLNITKMHPGIYINKVLASSLTGKPTFGASGLSANLWAMEKGELSNYFSLLKDNKINGIQFLICSSISMIKFIRRFIIIRLRRYER
ncbi:MAG TPA: hypothetical protein DCW95_09430 [Chryseobacterium sp.]|nr:hypothetical protein [Chryseobacterium sp.]